MIVAANSTCDNLASNQSSKSTVTKELNTDEAGWVDYRRNKGGKGCIHNYSS